MTLENRFQSEGRNNEDSNENIGESSAWVIPITSLETYLETIKDVFIAPLSQEEHIRALTENRNKIASKLENTLNEHLATEMEKHNLFEKIGYHPKEQELPRIENQSYPGNGFTLNSIAIYNENNEVVGYQLYRERMTLDEKETCIKSEIIKAYNTLSENKWFYVEQEINKQFEQKVRNGEMVYLGEKPFEEYIIMIDKGLPTKSVEVVRVFDSNMSPFDLKQKIYARIK